MSMGGNVKSPFDSGFSPRRHHDPKWHLAERLVGFSVLAEYDFDKGIALRHLDADPLNIGDDQSWVLWRSKSVGDRPVSAWSTAFSATVVSSGGGSVTGKTRTRAQSRGTMLPIFAPGVPDDRFESKVPRIGVPAPHSPRFPVGHTGHVSAGMVETSQEDIFHPDWLGALVAVNDPAASQELSNSLFDIGANGGLHPKRHAPLHRLFAALSMPHGTGIGLQLSTSGGKDRTNPALPFVDHLSGTVGLGAHYFGGGPFMAGGSHEHHCIKHIHGTDDLGKTIQPLHIAAGFDEGALFLDKDGNDAPLKFDRDDWEKTQTLGEALAPAFKDLKHVDFVGTKGWHAETFLRYDPKDFHFVQGPNGDYVRKAGKWKWQTPVGVVITTGNYNSPGAPRPEGQTQTRDPGKPGAAGGVSPEDAANGLIEEAGGVFQNPFVGRDASGRQIDQSRRGADPGPHIPSPQWPQYPWPGGSGPGPGGKGTIPPRPPRTPQEIADGVTGAADDIWDWLQGEGKETLPDGRGTHKGGVGPIGADGNPEFVFTLPGAGGFDLEESEGTKPTILPTPSVKQRGNGPTEMGLSSHCLGVPCMTWFVNPTDDEAPLIGVGGVPGDQLIDDMRSTPRGPKIEVVGTGDGTKGGQDQVVTGDGWANSPEAALVVMGGGSDFKDLLDGKTDPCDGAEEINSVARMNFPAGHSSIDVGGMPKQNSDFVTAGGYRIQGDTSACPVKVVMNPIDSEGVVDSTVGLVLDENGLNIKGTLKHNGAAVTSGTGKNSIGGDESDGTITLNANTSYGAVINAISWTLNATYNTYPSINKPLVLKCTGTQTLNGSVLLEGRGHMDPA